MRISNLKEFGLLPLTVRENTRNICGHDGVCSKIETKSWYPWLLSGDTDKTMTKW